MWHDRVLCRDIVDNGEVEKMNERMMVTRTKFSAYEFDKLLVIKILPGSQFLSCIDGKGHFGNYIEFLYLEPLVSDTNDYEHMEKHRYLVLRHGKTMTYQHYEYITSFNDPNSPGGLMHVFRITHPARLDCDCEHMYCTCGWEDEKDE